MPGFTPGSYGIGKCYIVTRDAVEMGVAVLRCSDLFNARLVTIQSAAEEQFISEIAGINASGCPTQIYN